MNKNKFMAQTIDYYADKFAEHGETARGVDWNGEESQLLCFDQLVKIINKTESFSLNDLGCGYGALFNYLSSHYPDFIYHGYDINENMIAAAKDRYQTSENAQFSVATEPSECADYGIASGIFTLRLGRSDNECRDFMMDTLDAMDRTSRRGFAFNCLTSYSDADKMRDYLYYPDPKDVFDHCKCRYSRNVALLHDYGRYAFTMLVRKML